MTHTTSQHPAEEEERPSREREREKERESEREIIPESSVGPAQLTYDPVQLTVDCCAHSLHHRLHTSQSLVDHLATAERGEWWQILSGEVYIP